MLFMWFWKTRQLIFENPTNIIAKRVVCELLILLSFFIILKRTVVIITPDSTFSTHHICKLSRFYHFKNNMRVCLF